MTTVDYTGSVNLDRLPDGTFDVVALYNALGGGWQDDPGDSQAPPIESGLPIMPAAVDSVAAGTPQATSPEPAAR